ncbi:unnamed protein product [Trichobilharzia regenti]|nr:unnamed protein product [Trichobilharzia regenti]
MQDARNELDDFQTSSRELEKELETHLEQLEKRNIELVVLCEKLTMEKERYRAIERNAFLENELCEKEDLVVTVQRLKDETRDLHQELAITRRQPDSIPHHEISDGDGAHPKKTNAKRPSSTTSY